MVGGTAYDTTGGRALVDGTAYSIQNGKTMVDGTVREIAFSKETPIANLTVGDSVYANVNGVKREFLIVHQGLPSDLYDNSCNGTWLLMKDIYVNRQWSNGSNEYKNSSIRSYLNGTFLNLFDSGIKGLIKSVKIPFVNGDGFSGNVVTGSKGLATQVFLLSGSEVKCNSYDTPKNEGDTLSYFSDGSNSKRVAMLNGEQTSWWLRSPSTYSDEMVLRILASGAGDSITCTASAGVRPAFVIDSGALVDKNNNLIV
jgi:hypothetical protein